jgi:signal transduction histidine kinase
MKRLKLLILLFCLAVSLPLGYVIWHTYQGLAQEERAQLRFFSETLFNEVEEEMAGLVLREENRAVDEYHYTLAQDTGNARKSPLSNPPEENYILGYLQNNPDGTFQTPLVSDLGRVPSRFSPIVAQLQEINAIFNGKKFTAAPKPAPDKSAAASESQAAPPQKAKAVFADRYLSKLQQQTPKSYLGQKSSRTEEITVGQALNLAKKERAVPGAGEALEARPEAPVAEMKAPAPALRRQSEPAGIVPSDSDRERNDASHTPTGPGAYAFQVEVAPLQSVFIHPGRFFIFRRIAIGNQIFRQGFVLQVDPFLRHLAAAHFDGQPMAAFAGLRLEVLSNGQSEEAIKSGRWNPGGEIITRRTFPPPFDFIRASVQAAAAPPSPVRRSLGAALAVLGLIMLLGLLAIYQSARTVMDLSERRSRFVSSVTHELKTPLTNIRMYIEMLEQGIAATPEREQDYLQIVGSESVRLSRLINNVLELAKLEKKQRRFDLRPAHLDEIFAEVRAIMGPKLKQEGFELKIEPGDLPAFAMDREVIIQILINLIENSIKFGRGAPLKAITIRADRHEAMARISVADTGPGIPRQALKRVFDDFYRVDNDATRSAGGTGIGLALVKKFVTTLGGRVQAVNNESAGCKISFWLPIR